MITKKTKMSQVREFIQNSFKLFILDEKSFKQIKKTELKYPILTFLMLYLISYIMVVSIAVYTTIQFIAEIPQQELAQIQPMIPSIEMTVILIFLGIFFFLWNILGAYLLAFLIYHGIYKLFDGKANLKETISILFTMMIPFMVVFLVINLVFNLLLMLLGDVVSVVVNLLFAVLIIALMIWFIFVSIHFMAKAHKISYKSSAIATAIVYLIYIIPTVALSVILV